MIAETIEPSPAAVVLPRWTAEGIEALRQLAFEGKTASQAASIVGFSKGACIGLSHRQGFRFASVHPQNTRTKNGTRRTLMPDQIAVIRDRAETGHSLPATAAEMGITIRSAQYWARKNQIKFKRGATVTAKTKIPLPFMAPPNGGITIVDIDKYTCRWPFGEPQDLETFRYCGGSVRSDGEPYCASHCAIAYAPPRTRRAA